MADVFKADFEGGIVDTSPLAQTVTLEDANATPTIETTTVFAGTQSLDVPEHSGISVPAHASMDFSTGFMFRGAVYFSALTTFDVYDLAGQWANGASGNWYIQYYHDPGSSELYLYRDPTDTGWWNSITPIAFQVELTAATWVDLIISFDGADYKLYVDEVLTDTVVNTDDFGSSTTKLTVGCVLDIGGGPVSSFVGFVDNITVSTTPYSAGPDLDDEITEGVGFDDAASHAGLHLATMSDGVATSLTQALLRASPRAIAENVRTVTQLLYAQGGLALETIGTNDALTDQVALLITEAFRTVEVAGTASKYQGLAADTAGLVTSLAGSWSMLLAETVGTQDALTVTRGVVVAEALGLLQGQVASTAYNLSLLERARLADSLGRFFGGDLSDGLGIAQAEVLLRTTSSTLADAVGVLAAVTPQLIVRAVAADGLALEPTQALAMLFAPDLVEGIQLSGGFVSPSGSFTTWAMNARTAAVTEYQNYAFTSFAKLGQHYIATSDNGLYELSGDSDDGADIIAQLKTGFTQFAGGRFTQIKAIYLAARGAGDYVLKVIAGTGREYHYGVTARDLETVRVRTGKGIQAHYFAFELISTGQDFDLGYLEFMPLVSERRV